MASLIQSLADGLFMPWVVVVLLGAGAFLTLKTSFVQLRRFGEAWRVALVRRATGDSGALTPFQAFMTALAASIGTGNIAGVATAVVSGGPGALFWIWVYGFVATAIKFGEAVLGMTFRESTPGGVLSGPMYYLRDGLRSPSLAWLFAFVAAVAALTTTPFTQPNSMALVLDTVFGIPRLASGITIAVLTWLVIIGGIASIGRAAEKLSPLKVGLYLTGGLIVILFNAARIPSVLALVFSEAFTTRSALGFGMFVAMRYGIARGIYANEAGYGTAAVAYGTARSTQPTLQGLNAVVEVFIVSFVTSSISGLTILLTGVWQSGADEHCRCRCRVQHGDADGGRLGGGVLHVSLRLHHLDWLGVLRRAVLRVHPGSLGDDSVPVDLLPAHSARSDLESGRGVGVGRSDERPSGLSKPDRSSRVERDRGAGGECTSGCDRRFCGRRTRPSDAARTGLKGVATAAVRGQILPSNARRLRAES